MTDDLRVRVDARSFGYRGETYSEGDELEVDPETAERHPRTLDVIETSSGEEVDENPDESGYSRDELGEMERSELQQLASNADTTEISGRSSNDAIIDYFTDDEE